MKIPANRSVSVADRKQSRRVPPERVLSDNLWLGCCFRLGKRQSQALHLYFCP